MKAVVYHTYGSPDVLKLAEVEKPIPKDNEVLVKVYATTVTVADFRSRSFTVPLTFWLPARITLGFRKPKKPILGVELAGEIESIGKDVKRFKRGDRVFAATLISYGNVSVFLRRGFHCHFGRGIKRGIGFQTTHDRAPCKCL